MQKIISLLLPTRGKPEMANAFIKSVEETADNISQIEIVVCTDVDDITAMEIKSEKVELIHISVQPGTTMGKMNQECFYNSSGKYVMLVNDDIIVHTKGWDTYIISAFKIIGDDIALVHVNDLLFGKSFCTFPIQSRKAIDIIGLTDTRFIRYRIDDNCYDTYAMLAEAGYKRIVYIPDVVFEHLNYETSAHSSNRTEYFSSSTGKFYIPNQQNLEHDAKLFVDLLPARKENAVKLVRLIGEKQGAIHKIINISDSNSCRKEENITEFHWNKFAHNNDYSITICIVTSDLYMPHAVECIRRVKKYTNNYNLIILDNNRSQDFNHPREMNKALSVAKTDYLVLLDDDVWVEENWIEGLVNAVAPDVALVAPLHEDGKGYLSFAGIRFLDEEGRHEHILHRPDHPAATEALCSACLLIDLKKMAGIFVNEKNQKYFLDIDYSLAAWERGYKCVVTPDVKVVHLGGATLQYGSHKNKILWDRDHNIFRGIWTNSGRLRAISDGIWRVHPNMRANSNTNKSSDCYAYINTLRGFPITLVKENIKGFNIIRIGDFYCAVLQKYGEVTKERLLNREIELLFWDENEVNVIISIYEASLLQTHASYVKKKIKKLLKQFISSRDK